MRLLEEADAAADAVGDAAPREFELQFERVVVRAVEHGDLFERHALVAQLKDARGDERRLLIRVARADERGRES